MKRSSSRDEGYRSRNLAKHTHPSRIYRYLTKRFEEALLRMLDRSNPLTVLEAGCGEGFLIKFLGARRPGYRFVGLDLAAGAVNYAVGQCLPEARFLVADVAHLPFASASFDTVICSEVLEHLPFVEPALAELRRVAYKHVLISMPREPYFRILARLVTWLGFGDDPGHVQFWSRKQLGRLLRGQFARVSIAASTIYRLAFCDTGEDRP